MSRKWIEREGKQWVDEGIISDKQLETLIHRYPQKKYALGFLPILGSILVGLGILSFIAANWDGIGQLPRLAILFAVMTGFYWAGERFTHKGADRLGIALTSIGLFTFGAAIFLIAQMFHLISYSASSFIAWGLAGLVFVWLYRSGYMFLLTLIILTAGQIYSLSAFQVFSPMLAAIMIIGLGACWWVRRQELLGWFLAAGVLLQSLMYLGHMNMHPAWFLIPLTALYALGDMLNSGGERRASAGAPLQGAALAAAFGFGVFIVLIYDVEFAFTAFHGSGWLYMAWYFPLLLLSAAMKLLNRRLHTTGDWLLLLPWVLLEGAGFVGMLALLLFSLYVLWLGYREESRLQINLGTVLFLASTAVAYGKLTWGFMDKSLFFLSGGLLLLLLSWLLNKRKRHVLDSGGNGRNAGKQEEGHNEK